MISARRYKRSFAKLRACRGRRGCSIDPNERLIFLKPIPLFKKAA